MTPAHQRGVERVVLLQPAGLKILIIGVGVKRHLRTAVRRVEPQTERHQRKHGGRSLPVVYHARRPSLRRERREQRPAPLIFSPPQTVALSVLCPEHVFRAAVGAFDARRPRCAAQRRAARAAFQFAHFHMYHPPCRPPQRGTFLCPVFFIQYNIFCRFAPRKSFPFVSVVSNLRNF